MVLKILRNTKLTINFKNYRQKTSKTLFDKSYIKNRPKNQVIKDTIPLKDTTKNQETPSFKNEIIALSLSKT